MGTLCLPSMARSFCSLSVHSLHIRTAIVSAQHLPTLAKELGMHVCISEWQASGLIMLSVTLASA